MTEASRNSTIKQIPIKQIQAQMNNNKNAVPVQ